MKTDLRIVKTKRAVEQAFFALIEEKGYENVHIVDIAEKAEVNRNTIYLHYESKEGIIKDVIEREFIGRFSKLELEKLGKLRFNRRKVELMFRTIFDIVTEQMDVYRILLTDANLAGYVSMTKRRIQAYVMESIKDTPRNRAILEYLVSGSYGVLSRWIVYANGTVDGNIKLLTDMAMPILRGIQI